MVINPLGWPLMQNNISRTDRSELCAFLMSDPPKLTQGREVEAFEREFAAWLGVKHAVFVNSGASANLITIAALDDDGRDEILVPAITWVSDIAAVLHAGYTPVFVDIDPRTLGMDWQAMHTAITHHARAVFLTHCLGFNAMGRRAPAFKYGGKFVEVPIIEDCCESLGAFYEGRKLGAFGLMSNFSFYYAHHMSTIEGGMVCTNDALLYDKLRCLRSHGMTREMVSARARDAFTTTYHDLHPEFIFAEAAFNVRSTELNAVLGRSQLRALDRRNIARSDNLRTFLSELDPDKYRTDYRIEGSSNYALPLVLKHKDADLFSRVCAALDAHGCEYRRGTAGGGNQLRQPYLRRLITAPPPEQFPEAEHVHFFGLYVGNFPELQPERIEALCRELNAL